MSTGLVKDFKPGGRVGGPLYIRVDGTGVGQSRTSVPLSCRRGLDEKRNFKDSVEKRI